MADRHGSQIQSLLGAVRARPQPDGRDAPARRRREWRATVRSRLLDLRRRSGAAGRPASRRGSSTCRSSQHDDLTARADRQQLRTHQAAGQARRDPRSQRPRARLQRRRRHDRGRSRSKSTTRTRSRAQRVRGARRLQRRSERAGDGRATLREARPFAYLRAAGRRPTRRARVKALELPGIAVLKESRRYYPNRELAAHVLGYVGLDNVGLAGLETTYDARIRGTRRQDAGADRRAAARAVQPREERRRPPATASS